MNFSQATSQLTQNYITRAELLRFIQKELEREGIKVKVDEQHGILRISEGVLFGIGAADVKPQGHLGSSSLSKWEIDENFIEAWIHSSPRTYSWQNKVSEWLKINCGVIKTENDWRIKD